MKIDFDAVRTAIKYTQAKRIKPIIVAGRSFYPVRFTEKQIRDLLGGRITTRDKFRARRAWRTRRTQLLRLGFVPIYRPPAGTIIHIK